MVIGVFTAQLDDAYQRQVWRGIAARAEETGHGLVCFVGQRLDAPAATEAARNVAYHLADRKNIDGLIVLSSTIGIFRGIDGVRALLTERDVPWVSLGVRLEGIPSVTADGKQAMAELVRHLIRHQRRRIALLAGPKGHPEAEERERAFRDELEAAGIAFDERLLSRGTFLSESGEEGARALLSRGVDFDAVVCLNDSMAMGAMSVFREAGVRIPTDVAITGFDDIPEARWTSPPLTTVAQPLEVLGRTAVDMILSLLNGHAGEDRRHTCNVVTRQSCGCPPARRTAARAAASEERQKRLEYLIPAEMRSALRENRREDFLNALNVALLASVPPLRSREETETDEILESWHAALQASAAGSGDAQLHNEAQALVSSVEIRAQAIARIAAFEQNQLIRSLSAGLAGSFGMETMIRQLSAGLQRLGIHAGYLVLFAAGADAPGPRRARLVMASPDLHHGSIEESADFDAGLLLPPRYLPRFDEGVWILEPLVFQEEALGYLILEGTHRDPSIFENLRDQVSSTLKGSLLMEKITGHEQELEIEVQRRTQELRRANLELRSLLAQRKALEREVQEISDKTMQTIGQDLHDDLCQNLAGISMFVSLLESELKEDNPALVESAARVRRMLEDSISRTRRIARGLYPPGLEERGLVATLEDLFDTVTRTGKVTISLQVAPSFPALASALALQVFRIIQEAVSNAIRHSGTDHIDVRLLTEDGRAWAEIQDFGCGLDPLSHGADDQGMGLRIMRYRAESIGAELTIDKLAPGVLIACSWDEKEQGDSHG